MDEKILFIYNASLGSEHVMVYIAFFFISGLLIVRPSLKEV